MSGEPSPRRRVLSGSRRSQPGSDPCDIQSTTELIGVRSEGVRDLSLGDVLDVVLISANGGISAVCRNDRGVIVGALAAFLGLGRLIDCLASEVRFAATVDDVGPTRCLVTVRRVEP